MKPELLAPGGSFAAAEQAFDAGADGVYLGLTEFSARKSAANFTLDQLRRILGLARQLGRTVYVTLNTVVREEEMPRLASLCAWLESLEVDGVIVQDLGTCILLARGFPRLAIHASTQMAIHNDSGLRFAEEVGIRRVILSRELPFERIRALRLRHPNMELEVFIHGALCYSFSGICLASWKLTGRSGNRGDCAQICRSVFCSDGERDGNLFSCRDLSLAADVLKLAEIGIDSLKIEGRMKSPEYVYHVTRLYRQLLDKGGAIPQGELEELQRNAETTFSREKTKGFFHSSRAEDLLTPSYPGHRGVFLGTVDSVKRREVRLRLQTRLSLHDGIGYWPRQGSDPVIFPVGGLRLGTKSIRFAEAHEVISLAVPDAIPLPPHGAEIRLFSSRFLDRPLAKESSLHAFRIPMRLNVTLREEGGVGALSCGAEVDGEQFTFERELEIIKSTGGKSFEAALRKHFEQSGSALLEVSELIFVNETQRSDADIFIPPSELKKIRNEIIASLETWFLSGIERRAHAGLSKARTLGTASVDRETLPSAELHGLSQRDLLTPFAGKPVPFASLSDVQQGPAALPSRDGYVFLPLPPVMMNDDAWLEALQTLVDGRPHIRFALGLNNVGHLELARKLVEKANCFFFVDFYLYVANLCALDFLAARISRLLFAYSWIEGDAAVEQPAGERGLPAVIDIAADFRPPLFYSLGCFERHAVGRGQCRDDCPQGFVHELRQGRNQFSVIVKDCVTYLFQPKRRDRNG